ncbi:taurine catabolism dioxygenase TauD [Xenorhabdus sp. SGI246]|uniref:taurine catabolism dioxygenase TauD n=1 Tax=Xenorhabdus sp. SGI246 TaxID=3158263 RepID=UPI00349F5828
MISVYKFDKLENKAIFNALNIINVNPYKNYLNFKREVSNLILLEKVPKKFIDICHKIKDERRLYGINAQLLKNLPIDRVVPEFDQEDPVNDKYRKKTTFIGESLLELFSQLTDSPLLAYQTRNNGDFFHDVYAHKKYSNTQTQKTDGELYFHNDRTAHPVRADFLSLLGMRCSEQNLIYTGYLDGKEILSWLKPESQQWLRQPWYITPYDEYSRDSNKKQLYSEKHVILENIHTFRYYDTRTTYLSDAPKEAIEALLELKIAITKAKKERVSINSGDLFSFANQDSLHNREIIKVVDKNAMKKRWLLKTYSFRNEECLNKYREYFHPEISGLVQE